MPEISVQDAAFTGFRIVRERPRALLAWALVGVVASFAFALIFVGLLGRDAQSLLALNAQPARNLDAMQALVARMAPGYALLFVTGLAFNAVVQAAMIRAVLQPDQARLGYLRLGADEWRQFVLSLYTSVVFLGLYTLGVLLVGTALAAGVQSVSAALAILAALVLVIGMLWLAVRLSLAPPLTFDASHIRLFRSWTLTRGRGLRLLGTYALALALAVVVYVLAQLVVEALSALLSGGDLAAATAPANVESFEAYFTPYRLIQTVLTAFGSALVWPVIFTPAAAVYRSVRPGTAASAEAFA